MPGLELTPYEEGVIVGVLLGEGHFGGDGRQPQVTVRMHVRHEALVRWLQERLPLSSYRRPLLGTGLCGALTTFSAMQLELLRMLDGRHLGLAAAYAVTSLVAGFVAVAAATNLVRRARWWGSACSAAPGPSPASCSTPGCRR